jgi:nitroreductase
MPEVAEVIRQRRSSRAFSDRTVEREKVELLLEAFRWAPSSYNRQPWRIIVAEEPAARKAWDAALIGGNERWAPAASVKLIVVGNPAEQPSVFGQQRWLLDCGLALGQLLIQAGAVGLNIRAMAGFDEDSARSAFNIPEPFRVAAFVAGGYPAELGDLPPEIQERERRPRVRKPLSDVVFQNRFGSSW